MQLLMSLWTCGHGRGRTDGHGKWGGVPSRSERHQSRAACWQQRGQGGQRRGGEDGARPDERGGGAEAPRRAPCRRSAGRRCPGRRRGQSTLGRGTRAGGSPSASCTGGGGAAHTGALSGAAAGSQRRGAESEAAGKMNRLGGRFGGRCVTRAARGLATQRPHVAAERGAFTPRRAQPERLAMPVRAGPGLQLWAPRLGGRTGSAAPRGSRRA